MKPLMPPTFVKTLSTSIFVWLIRRFQTIARYLTKATPENPVELYGYATTVRVQIKSLQLLTDSTAQVRFQSVKTTGDREVIDHWVAVLSFRYVQKPTSLADRFQNPLGFQITRYRRDQEIVRNP